VALADVFPVALATLVADAELDHEVTVVTLPEDVPLDDVPFAEVDVVPFDKTTKFAQVMRVLFA